MVCYHVKLQTCFHQIAVCKGVLYFAVLY